MDRLGQGWLLLWTRPIFRVCEVVCNHAARVLGMIAGPGARQSAELDELNEHRAELQQMLQGLSGGHGEVCAECRGRCCHGPRNRQTYIDHLLQTAGSQTLTPTLSLGWRGGTEASPQRLPDRGGRSGDQCSFLSAEGCRLPYHLRPMQCAAYYCGSAVRSITSAERAEVLWAVRGLMRVHLRAVALMLRSKVRAVSASRPPFDHRLRRQANDGALVVVADTSIEDGSQAEHDRQVREV